MHAPRVPARTLDLRATWAIGIAVSLLALVGPSAMAGGPESPGSAEPARALSTSSSTSPCPGTQGAPHYLGNVTDVGGGSSAPPLSNQSVQLAYRYTQTFVPEGGGTSQYLCVSTLARTTSGSGGAFTANATLPNAFCNKPYGCWYYSGPYGPITLGLGSGALPPGYFLNVSVSHGSYTLARVLALDEVTLAPAGFTTVSVDAPDVVAATAWSAQGTPSPANVTFAWSMTGTGWRAVSPMNASSVTVEAISTNDVATVEVWVNGTYGGAVLQAPPVSVLLTAAATSIQTGAVRPTSVDEGVPTAFSWTGTGSMGYAYTADLEPGFDLPPVAGSCTNRSISGGLLEFDCAATFLYAQPGLAQPFATLSNPFSSANYSFSQVTVSAGLGVEVTPDPAVAYLGDPIEFTVAVAAGSGSAPYGPACLSDGIGGTVCHLGSGASWQFPTTYGALGQYQAEATVADSGGANDTVRIPVTIVDRPSLDTLTPPSSEVPQGGQVSASIDVFGGALPLAYWWNTTASSTIGGGTMASDGPLSIAFPAGDSTGVTNLTLTVVDALGTVVHASATFYVVATTAVKIDLLAHPFPSAWAGSPYNLSFEAVDVLQDPAVGFSGAFGVTADPAGLGEVWVNDSAGEAIASANGTFEIPTSAWDSGYLNLTFTESAAVVFNLSFSAPAPIVGPGPLRLTIGPDLGRELLVHRDVVRPGARTNSTLYEIEDRFGNPIPSGAVVVQSEFGSTRTNVDSPILTSNGVAFVWVNYSAVGSGAGVVEVLSTSGRPMLSISVPALPSSPLDLLEYAAVGGLAAAGVSGGAILARRRRPDPSEAPVAAGDASVEEGLKRLAEGRAHVLDRVPFDAPVDLDHIALGWTGPPPDAAELAEWVGSLVSEGALRASIGPEGRPMFVRVQESVAPSAPRVEVDPMALDAALERQRIESRDPEAPSGGEGRTDPDGPPD